MTQKYIVTSGTLLNLSLLCNAFINSSPVQLEVCSSVDGTREPARPAEELQAVDGEELKEFDSMKQRRVMQG